MTQAIGAQNDEFHDRLMIHDVATPNLCSREALQYDPDFLRSNIARQDTKHCLV